MTYRRFVLGRAPAPTASPAPLREAGIPFATGSGRALGRPSAVGSPPRLVAPAVQIDPFRCFVCDQPFAEGEAIVAVLSDIPGERFWLHHACHDEHIRRCAAARAGAAQ